VETGGCPPDAIDELESHLRDEYERLVRAGEQPGPALEQAIARLGTPRALGDEFAKVAPPVAWVPARVATTLFTVAAVAVPAWLAYLWRERSYDPLLMVHVITVTLGYGATLLLGGVAGCYVVRRL